MRSFKQWMEAIGEPFIVNYDVEHLIDSILEDFPLPRQELSQMVHDLVARNPHLSKKEATDIIKSKIKKWLPNWGTGHSGRPPWVSAKMAQIATES